MSADNPSQLWYSASDTDERNAKARDAYKALYTFLPWMEAEMGVEMQESKGEIYLEGLYDGFLLFANVINRTLEADHSGPLPNQSLRGTTVIGTALGMSFAGKRLKNNQQVDS